MSVMTIENKTQGKTGLHTFAILPLKKAILLVLQLHIFITSEGRCIWEGIARREDSFH